MAKIFVQIASYRDPLLLSTIQDCLDKALHPENLTFGICYQDDNFFKNYDTDSRFQIKKIPYKESKGACWARSITNEMYQGEEFTLQIDSHMRFVKNWDVEILKIWLDLNDPKAVLTSYPPEFLPEQKQEEWKQRPHTIHVYSFKDNHTQQRPYTPKEWEKRTTPYKAVHVAAGFIFAAGSFVKDIPYDPDFYFSGEETALAVRSFTHGYNLYHPHKIILWHYYGRKDQPKHWTDNKDWGELGKVAKSRLNCLLGRNNDYKLGKYGLGKVRTLEDFQNYSGIDYKRSILHLDTMAGKEPPVDLSDKEKWSYTTKTFKRTMSWKYDEIDNSEEPRFWAFIFKDQNNQELYRKDIKLSENADLITGKITEKEFEFTYYSPAQIPTTFIIWPYSQTSMKWLKMSKFEIK